MEYSWDLTRDIIEKCRFHQGFSTNICAVKLVGFSLWISPGFLLPSLCCTVCSAVFAVRSALCALQRLFFSVMCGACRVQRGVQHVVRGMTRCCGES